MMLRVPGPTPLPPEVQQAEIRPMIDHRSPEFSQLQKRIVGRLKHFFQTENEVYLLTSSGTGAMEAAVVNVLSPGQRVLCVSIGNFGERFGEIARIYGVEVIWLRFANGEVASTDAIKDALTADPSITAVLVTHNETSSGTTNPLAKIAEVVRRFDKLLIVDGISSVGSIEIKTDEWGCDVVVSGSQKGWMTPPGMAFVSLSPRAWAAYEQSKMPRYYFDLGQARRFAERGQTPWTPAVSIAFALDKGLELLEQEGRENVFARHARIAATARAGVRELGLKIVPQDDANASSTVTAVWLPEGVTEAQLRGGMREQNIIVAGGQAELSGKIFRIGHLGYISDAEIATVLAAVRTTLSNVAAAPSTARS